jgi:hypothetical protein
LPKQTILVDWNYGWDMNNFGDHQKLVESGFQVWGAPAIRSHPDNYFLTEWEKHFKNIHDFIPVCRQLGYTGIIMTSWSTSGEYSTVWEASDDLAGSLCNKTCVSDHRFQYVAQCIYQKFAIASTIRCS